MSIQYKNNQGFTLTELAIVIVIVAVLIFGILKGIEIVNNTRVIATANKMQEIKMAMDSFKQKYSQLPGDFVNARTRLPNCTATTACNNGNGDYRLGPVVGASAAEPWASVPATIGTENVQFWKHLALADLIQDVDGTATTTGWGVSHPQAPLHGGFHARTSAIGAGNNSTMSGLTMTLRNNIQGLWQCTAGADCSATPKNAADIDRKIDDGNAIRGKVQAISENWSSGCGDMNAGTQGPNGYDENITDLSCDIMFKLDSRETR